MSSTIPWRLGSDESPLGSPAGMQNVPLDSHRRIKGGRSSSLPTSDAKGLPAGKSVLSSWRIVDARAGDHPSIFQFLRSVLHAPSSAEFLALEDDPFYEPNDRVMIKAGRQILAHAHITRRSLLFGGTTLPLGGVLHLATLPECRSPALTEALLAAVDRKLIEQGAILGITRTSQPAVLEQSGWVRLPVATGSTSSPRDILAQLRSAPSGSAASWRPSPPPLCIRLWRHIEQDALSRLYDRNTMGAFGPLVRTDAYWRWLISRQAYDGIYVAIEGNDRLTLEEGSARIVGYSVIKEGHILELMGSPERPDAASQLLARACADAIERDHHRVLLDAPANDPLHRLVAAAGGEKQIAGGGGFSTLVRVFDLASLVHQLGPELLARAKSADVGQNWELGLTIEGQGLRLVGTRRSVKLLRGKRGRSYLGCDRRELTLMLLGGADLASSTAAGRLHCSTRIAEDLARVLFPPLPLWRPAWDDLPA